MEFLWTGEFPSSRIQAKENLDKAVRTKVSANVLCWNGVGKEKHNSLQTLEDLCC